MTEEWRGIMQFVRTAELKPGMRLAKPIYNKRGVLLYERGTKLTAQGIESIKNFGLIGIFTLEPAEPLPPLSKEDLEFEQFQTVYVFQLKENITTNIVFCKTIHILSSLLYSFF